MEISTQISGNGFSMKDLLAKSGLELPKIGELLTGEIISVSKNAVLIDLGSLGTGIVYPGEFYDNPDLQKALKPGQSVSGILLDIENEDGFREISLKRAQMTTAWQDIRNKKESGETITTKIVNINKGGLIVEINGIQGFLPLSQLTSEHYPKVEGGDTTKIVQALQKMRGQEVRIKIIDFSENENRLIVSERAINEAEMKEELAKFKAGDIVDAEITDVTDFGAFAMLHQPSTVNDQLSTSAASTQPEHLPTENAPLPPTHYPLPTKIEGLIHISEIDWKLIDDPRDFLKNGQHVQAKIIGIDGNKVSLSLKALKPDPWVAIEEKYRVGQTITGEVAKITNYGALIRLDEEITGLLPALEFGLPAQTGEQKSGEPPKVGDKLTVAIVTVDPKEHKLLLTLQNNTTETQKGQEDRNLDQGIDFQITAETNIIEEPNDQEATNENHESR